MKMKDTDGQTMLAMGNLRLGVVDASKIRDLGYLRILYSHQTPLIDTTREEEEGVGSNLCH